MNCWFWNISLDYQDYFKTELENGRLRQGWGYSEKLNLRKIEKKLKKEKTLTKKEQKAWDRCEDMLNSIGKGDLIVVKNIPDKDHFVIAKSLGEYDFDIENEIGDFGHILLVEKIAEYNKSAQIVPAPMVNALERERHPIRRTLKHKQAVINLANHEVSDEEATKPENLKEKLKRTRSNLISPLQENLKNNLDPKLAEKLVYEMFRYDGVNVIYNAGAYEKGADLLTEIQMDYGIETSIAVQIKMHWGTDNSVKGLEQLVEAFKEYDVHAGVLVTFADELGKDLKNKIEEVQKEYNINVIYGEDLYFRLLELIADPNFEINI